MNRALLFIIITLFTLVKWNMGYTADWCGYDATATLPATSVAFGDYTTRVSALEAAKHACNLFGSTPQACAQSSNPALCEQLREWHLACQNARNFPTAPAPFGPITNQDMCLQGYACLSKQLNQTGSPGCFKHSGTSASGITPATASCDEALWGISAAYTPGVPTCGSCPELTPIFVYDPDPTHTAYTCKSCADVNPATPFYNVATQTCQKGATLIGLNLQQCQKLYGPLASQKFKLLQTRNAIKKCKKCSALKKSELQKELALKETCCKLLNKNKACPAR